MNPGWTSWKIFGYTYITNASPFTHYHGGRFHKTSFRNGVWCPGNGPQLSRKTFRWVGRCVSLEIFAWRSDYYYYRLHWNIVEARFLNQLWLTSGIVGEYFTRFAGCDLSTGLSWILALAKFQHYVFRKVVIAIIGLLVWFCGLWFSWGEISFKKVC